MVRPAWVAVIAAAAAACTEPDSFSGDPFPIAYVSRAGAVTVEVRAPDELARPAVLDVLSPLTVLDPGPDIAPERQTIALELLGLGPSGGTVPRARLEGTVIRFHPCTGEATCSVGDPANPFPVTATVGTDLLSGDAVRFDFAASQLYVLPDIAGDLAERTRLCDGVFIRPFEGAGTLVLEGAEVPFTSRRIVVEACLGPSLAVSTPAAKRGGDGLFVISTGLGANIMSESAYLRYADSSAIPVEDLLALPDATVRIVSGPISGRLGTVPSIAVVGTAAKDPRGPCRENVASTYVENADPDNVCPPGVDCPCIERNRSCVVPSIVRFNRRGGVPFLVVSDEEPLLQALRTELRPLVGEVDGILGTDVLDTVELDIDYPHDRLLWRCTNSDGCEVRPQLDGFDDQPQFLACIAAGRPTPVTKGER